jgi:hypothetical protein
MRDDGSISVSSESSDHTGLDSLGIRASQDISRVERRVKFPFVHQLTYFFAPVSSYTSFSSARSVELSPKDSSKAMNSGATLGVSEPLI